VTRRNTVLIYRLGSLGDTVVALPCFHLLARTFADSVRVLLTNTPVHAKAPAASSVLGESGLIHEYISYSVGTRNIIELAKLCWKIRRLRVRTMVYLTPPRGEAAVWRDEIFFRLCGVKEIIGIPRGELATHGYDPVADRCEAEASRLARCLARIGDARLGDPASWDLLLTEHERARATSALRPLNGTAFLALGIASKQSVTDWGTANWKELMPRLRLKFPEHALVFIGAKEDRSAIEGVASQWAGRSLNLSGDLSPRESAAVIQRGDLFLGVDSGPMHLAASVGTPCVSISAANRLPGMWFPFGDAHEVIYHKTECFGCNLEVCIIERKRCILSISVDEVVAAALRAVERKQATLRG
jgi:heptosyltransferase III